MPTWTGAGADNNYSTVGNWDTGVVPNSTSDAIFDGNTGLYPNANKNCIITPSAQCRSLNCTGYAGTITFTNNLTVYMDSVGGNITFSSTLGFSLAGPFGITYQVNVTATARTITTNGYNYNLPFTVTGLGGSTINLVGIFQVTNYTGASISFNGTTGNELRVSGNWSSAAFGSALKVLNGTGTMATGSNVTNLVIDAPTFTRTFSGTVTISGTLTWIAGTLVTSGSTIQLGVTNINFPTTQPLNNVTILNGIYTMTLATNVYVNGNFIFENGVTINGNKFFVQGNFTSLSGSGGTTVIEMTGTGTITGTSNLSITSNSPSGVITFALNAIMGGGFTYQSGTLNLTNNLQVRGPLVINNPVTVTGTGRLYFLNYQFLNTTINVTSNGHSWPNDVEIQASGGGGNLIITLNLIGDFRVLGNFFVSLVSTFTFAQTINNNTLFVRGNFTVTVPNGLNGTANIVLEGSSSTTLSATTIDNNLNINKSGVGTTLSILSSFAWGAAGRTLQKTAGIINPNSFTVTIPAISCTINNMTFNNLTIASQAVITQNVLNTINSTLLLNTVSLGTTTFTGTAGWTCASLVVTGVGIFNIILQNGITYTTTTAVQLTGGTNTNRYIMISNSPSVRAIWTVGNTATQAITYVDGTRIDSSAGATVWTLGTVSTTAPATLNWNNGSQPSTVGYTFVN